MQFFIGFFILSSIFIDDNNHKYYVDAQITSYFGSGICFTNQSLYIVERVGLQMCLTVCVSNSQCLSVDHNIKTLRCFLYDIDSEDYSDYKAEPSCTHYSTNLYTPDSRYHCTGDECLSLQTCVKLSTGIHHCVQTECSAPQLSRAISSIGVDTIGSSKTVTCDSGYELGSGMTSQVITCRSNGYWNGTGTCNLPECPEPTPPTTGTILPGDNTVGSTRAVQCNTGYAQIGGSATIECLVSQTWTAWTGSCEICGEPTSIQNAVISEGNKTVGSNRTYSCITGYTGNGESPSITCDDSAIWTTTIFSCSLVDCGSPPSITGATYTSSGSTWLSTAAYSCSYGFSFSGNGTIVCSSSGEWTSAMFNCTSPSTATIDFEDDDLYNMVNAGGSYKPFDSDTDETTSSDTGPNGPYHGTKYRYYEATYYEAFDVARMESDVYFSADVRCIDFYYSMYGADIGTLRIKYKEYSSSSETQLWSDTGDKGEPTWFNANVTVTVTEIFKLIVEATKGSSYYGDAAIDYIRLFDFKC